MTLVPQFGHRRSVEDVVFLAMREKAIPIRGFHSMSDVSDHRSRDAQMQGKSRTQPALRNAVTPHAAMISQHSLVDPPSFGESLRSKLLSGLLRFPFQRLRKAQVGKHTN